MPVVVDTLMRTADGSFVGFDQVDRYTGDPTHLLGAVTIHVDGKPLLTPAEWDELDWLWPFLVRAIEEMRASGAGETFFPDQPILFRAERLPTAGRVLVTVDLGDRRRGAAADEDELIRAIAGAGLAFFRKRDRIVRGGGSAQREADLCAEWLGAHRP